MGSGASFYLASGGFPAGLVENQAWRLGPFEASSCVRTDPAHICRPVRRWLANVA